MVCSTFMTLTSTATQFITGAADNRFQLNSIYSPTPDAAATLQPYGEDVYEGLYQRFIVKAATVHVDVGAYGSSNQPVITMRVDPGSITGNTQSTSASTLRAEPFTSFIWPSFQNATHYTFRILMHEIEGLTAEQYRTNIADYAGTAAAAPAKIVVLRLNIADTTAATAVTMYPLVTVVYEVEWFDRIPLGPSSHA